MADWYCSSAAYALIPVFAVIHVYSIGDIIKPTAPAVGAKYAFRCTTGGTSSTEPVWNTSNNGTSTSNTVVFTNVTGQSTYFWAAAAGDLASVNNRVALGDRAFLSSDHTETQTGATTYGWNVGSSYTPQQFLSVNRAGSTPPVAADLTPGATLICSNQLRLSVYTDIYWYGVNFSVTGSSNLCFGPAGASTSVYLDTCQLFLNTSSSVQVASSSANNNCGLILDNSTVQFGAVGQSIGVDSSNPVFNMTWFNTPSAIPGGTFPTTLFDPVSGTGVQTIVLRGVDISAITTTLVKNSTNGGSKYLFDSCKIASGVTRYSTTSVTNTRDSVDLVNCFDGTNYLYERYTPAGTMTTERTIVCQNGAADEIGPFSYMVVTTANIDKYVQPFETFWMDCEYATTGSPKTATVEIISQSTLQNDEISLVLEYQGTSSSSVGSFGTSFVATPLTTPANVTSSGAIWSGNLSGAVTQKLQVTFTPQTAGRVRGVVRVGKASATVYVNPVITIT